MVKIVNNRNKKVNNKKINHTEDLIRLKGILWNSELKTTIEIYYS